MNLVLVVFDWGFSQILGKIKKKKRFWENRDIIRKKEEKGPPSYDAETKLKIKRLLDS